MDIALLLVRVVIGLGFAAHGAQKLFGWFGGYGIAGTGGYFESTLGFKPGAFFAAASGFAELAGGLLLALGLFGPVGPMFVVAVMLTAMLTAHKGWFAPSGIELPVAYSAVAVLVAIAGPGAYSLDAALGLGAIWTTSLSWSALGLGVLGGLANAALRRKPVATQQPQA
ncbi:MAG: DoxX family protein [Candidatus Eremiobacteraeota bacterium]|nr:DoxX family protein [Candidatus Eremiobacteraeota bacterium]